MWRRTKCSPSRQNMEQKYLIMVLFFSYSNHKIGASMLQGLGTGKMHKVIKMTVWANLPIHCRNHTVLIIFSNAEGSPSDQHEGQLWAVQLCPDYVLTSKDQDYLSALCSVHALFLPVETRAQKVGDDACLDTAQTFDMRMCEYGHNRARPYV